MSLIAHYKLDGLAASIGQDLTYFNNSGKLVPADGKFGTAYQRMGLNDGADYFGTTEDIHLSSSFTMSCWAYVTSAETTANGLVTNHDYTTNTGAGINVKYISPTDFRISCNTGTGTSRTYDSYYGTSNIKDRWSHLLLRFDASTNNLSLWVDGVEEFSMTYAMKCVPDKLQLFKWSTSYDTPNYRPGAIIDDVRIYDHALSEREVRDLSQGLVLHYTFDQFQEPTENKASGITYSSYAPYHNISGDANKVTMVCATTNIYMTIAGFGTLQGKTITVSGYMKKNGVSYLPPLDKTSTYETATAVKHVMDSSTGRFEVTQVYDSTSDWLFHTPITAVAGDVITIEEFQVEFNKGYATPFVNGTRAGIVRDQSTQGNDAPLALANTPKWVEGGMVGKGCYEFDGVNDYIDISSKIKDIRFDRGFTLSCWAFPTIVSSWARFLDIGVGQQNNNIVFSRYSTTNQLFFEVKNGTSNGTVISGGSIPLNSWSFLTVTVSESMSTVLYINGVQVATGTSTSPQNVSRSSSFIAKSNWSWDSFYKGQIDDIRIYTTALTPEEIKEIYQQRASLDSGGNLLC